jgi:hypothetical protein
MEAKDAFEECVDSTTVPVEDTHVSEKRNYENLT